MKSLIFGKLVNSFSLIGCPVLGHFKNINFIGREYPNLEEGVWKYRDIVGKYVIFPKAPLISLTFDGW